jgi:hypothetical protein
MPLSLAHLYWSLFHVDRSFCLKAHQADVDVIMTIRVTLAYVARCLGLPLPGKINYHFSQPGRRMKKQEQMLESLHALEVDTGDTLEVPNNSIEEVEKERLGVWESGESGPMSEELDSDEFELAESEVGDFAAWDSETSDLEETEHEIEESEVGDSETSDLGEAEHEIEG